MSKVLFNQTFTQYQFVLIKVLGSFFAGFNGVSEIEVLVRRKSPDATLSRTIMSMEEIK